MRPSSHIYYTKGYKYQLREPAYFQTQIYPTRKIVTPLVELWEDGTLIVREYFSWDGASGPTWDNDSNMRASLAHDALYYLMRQGFLSLKWRKEADRLLKRLMLEDGSWECRAKYYFWAVTNFAKTAAKNKRKIYKSPKGDVC